MESQSQNLEIRINPENFHPCKKKTKEFWPFPVINVKHFSTECIGIDLHL